MPKENTQEDFSLLDSLELPVNNPVPVEESTDGLDLLDSLQLPQENVPATSSGDNNEDGFALLDSLELDTPQQTNQEVESSRLRDTGLSIKESFLNAAATTSQGIEELSARVGKFLTRRRAREQGFFFDKSGNRVEFTTDENFDSVFDDTVSEILQDDANVAVQLKKDADEVSKQVGDRDSLNSIAARGITSVATTLLAGTSKTAIGASAVLQGAGDQSIDYFQKASGELSSEDRELAVALGAGLGLTEIFPTGKLVRRYFGDKNFTENALKFLDETSGGTLSRFIKTTAKGTIEEGGQEILQSLGKNLIANKIVAYDAERDTYEGVAQAGEEGAITGFLLNALSTAFGGRRQTTNRGIDDGQTTSGDNTQQSSNVNESSETRIDEAGNIGSVGQQAEGSGQAQTTSDVGERSQEGEGLTENGLGNNLDGVINDNETENNTDRTTETDSISQETTEQQRAEVEGRSRIEENQTQPEVNNNELESNVSQTDDQLGLNQEKQEENINQEEGVQKENNEEGSQESVSEEIAGISNNIPVVKRVLDNVAPFPTSPDSSRLERALFSVTSKLSNFKSAPTSLGRIIRDSQYEAEAVEAQLTELSNVLNQQLNKSPNKVVYSDLASQALAGDSSALNSLPENIQKTVVSARENFDSYSKGLVDAGFVDGELATSLGDNLGKYVLRQYKVFDPEYKWNYTTVRENRKDIYDAAIREIKDVSEVSTVEADSIVKEILSSSRSEGFINGNSKAGKIDVRSFIKRQDLSQPIRELLGEITNPVENIRATGRRTSAVYSDYSGQRKMRDAGLDSGLFSLAKNNDIRHETLLGDDGNGNVRKQYAGFGEVYTTPEIASALDDVLNTSQGKSSLLEQAGKAMSTLSGAGKFAQVILNPASYPTNLMGALSTEILNGRMILSGKGLKGIKKGTGFSSRSFKTKGFNKLVSQKNLDNAVAKNQYTLNDRLKLYDTKASDLTSKDITDTILVNEMRQRGILDRSVFGTDVKETFDQSYTDVVKNLPVLRTLDSTKNVLSKAYQVPDNIGKYNAFTYELDKYMKAFPDKKMSEIIDLAATDTKLTTQNYDLVPTVLRKLSQYGLGVPTYVSFSYELVRNTVNTAKLAKRELASGNKVLMAHGARRVAGMATLSLALNALISQSPNEGEEDEQTRDSFEKDFAPPWLKNKNILLMKNGEGRMTYADPSYLIPHNMFLNVFKRIEQGESEESIIVNGMLGFMENFTDINILTQLGAEVLTNKKANGAEIYNPLLQGTDEEDKWSKIVQHIIDGGFTPGFERTRKQLEKLEKGDIGYMGTIRTGDDMMMQFLGLRPITVDKKKAFSDKFQQLAFNYANSKRIAPTNKSESTSQEKHDEKVRQEEAALEKHSKELIDFSKRSLRKGWGMSESDLLVAIKKSRIDKKMKLRILSELNSPEDN